MGGTARARRGTVRQEITAEFAPHTVEKYIDGMPGRDGEQVAYVVASYDKDGETVRYAAVVLYEDRPGRFGFYTKVMDETEGPHYYDMPVSFLEGLSEPLGYAAGYREKVRARAAEKAARASRGRERDYGGAYDGMGTVYSDADGGL
jgi:hypothetical protein